MPKPTAWRSGKTPDSWRPNFEKFGAAMNGLLAAHRHPPHPVIPSRGLSRRRDTIRGHFPARFRRVWRAFDDEMRRNPRGKTSALIRAFTYSGVHRRPRRHDRSHTRPSRRDGQGSASPTGKHRTPYATGAATSRASASIKPSKRRAGSAGVVRELTESTRRSAQSVKSRPVVDSYRAKPPSYLMLHFVASIPKV